jgi:hypothetical protein
VQDDGGDASDRHHFALAKIQNPRGLEDENEAHPHQGVETPQRQAADDHLEKKPEVHAVPPE